MRLFVYLSEILEKKVFDSSNNYVGRICDLHMRHTEEVFPKAEGLIVKKGTFKKKYAKIPFEHVREINGKFELTIDKKDILFEHSVQKLDFSLCRDILDQQVVDTHDQKVVRVNDVHLLRVDNQIYLAHVDVGLRGIVRRLDWSNTVDAIVKAINPKSPYLNHEELVAWKNTQVLTLGRNRNVLKLGVARNKFSKIPPTDLADIMEDLDIFEKITLFKSLNVDLQRKVFTEMTPQEKEELVEQLKDKEASNLIENIPADEATDLLTKIPKDKRHKWLRLMQSEKSKQLRMLLGFEQDTAGGLMTTEYLYLKMDAKVKDAIQKLKESVNFPGNIYHIYIVDDNQIFKGMTSIRRFIDKDLESPLKDTCHENDVFVRLDDDLEEIALLLEKYKFTSIPVVDDDNVLQGVITSDDVMEELISLAWKKYKDQI